MRSNKAENCPAVLSVIAVWKCPTSSDEYNRAASRKDCSQLASKRKCSEPEKYKYHCVINSFKNGTFDACAHEKKIFGKIFVYKKQFMVNIQTDYAFELKLHCSGIMAPLS